MTPVHFVMPHAPWMFTNVIVGVDAGEGGRDAIALATQLVDSGGRLTLAHAYPDEAPMTGRSAAADEANRTRALDLLERAREQAGIDAQLRTIRRSRLVTGCTSSRRTRRPTCLSSARPAMQR